MTPRCRRLLAVVLLLCSFAVPALAQNAGSIQGTVVGPLGGPLAGVNVELQNADGWGMGSTSTGVDGMYLFEGLAPGYYVVRVPSSASWMGQYYPGVSEFDQDLARRIRVNATPPVTGIDVALAAPGVAISGTVNNLGAGGADVSVVDAVTQRYRGSARIGPGSPEPGSFSVGSLPPGTYKIRVNPFGSAQAFVWFGGAVRFSQATSVPVSTTNVTVPGIPLSAGTSLSGTITLSGTPLYPGNPFWGIWVDACDAITTECLSSSGVDGGLFQIANLPADSYFLRANTSGSGFIREVWSATLPNLYDWSQATPIPAGVGSPATGKDFALDKGFSISGTVSIDADGDGVADRPAGSVYVNADPLSGGWGDGTGADWEGHYTITGLRAGQYSVRAEARYADELFVAQYWNRRTLLQVPTPVEISASNVNGIDFLAVPGRQISGVVVDDVAADGLIAGDPVLKSASVGAYDFMSGRWAGNALWGADGLYHLALPPGTFRVDASAGQSGFIAESYLNAWFSDLATPVAVTDTAGASNIDFTLVRGALFGVLTGRVVDSGGSPIPDLDVQVRRFDNNWGVAGALTDASGNFAITNLPPSVYRIYIETARYNAAHDTDYIPLLWSAPGDPNDQSVVFPTVPGVGTDLGTMVLTQGGSIAGTVSRTDVGALPSGLSVGLSPQYSTSQWMPGASVDTTTGEYRVRGVTAGAYRVSLGVPANSVVPVSFVSASESSFDHNLAATITLGAGQAMGSINLFTYAGVSLTGTVTGGGAPLAGVQVNAGTDGYWFGGGTQTRADGTYEMTNLVPGTYTVSTDVRTGPWANQTLFGVSVPGSADFVLAAAGTIAGTVTLDVKPASPASAFAQMCVQAVDAATGRGEPCLSVTWDGNADGLRGMYSLGNLAAGTYTLQAHTGQSGYVFEVWTAANTNRWSWPDGDPLTVAAGTTQTANVQLELGGSISGLVFLDSDGDSTQDANEPSLPGASVNVFLLTSGGGSGTSTDSTGRYLIVGLRPGSSGVSVAPTAASLAFVTETFDGQNALGATPTPVVVTAGGASTADFSVIPGVAITGVVFADTNNNRARDDGELFVTSGNVQAQDFATGACCYNAPIGANGSYELRVPPGVYRVQAWQHQPGLIAEFYDNKYSGDEATSVDVTAGPKPDVNFSLIPAATYGYLHGGVLTPGGQGIEGVSVRVQRFESPWWEGGVASTTTAPDGSYAFTGLPPAEYQVRFDTSATNASNSTNWVSSYWSSSGTPGTINTNDMRVAHPAGSSGTNLGNFRLLLGGSVSGTVHPVPSETTLPLPFQVSLSSFESSGESLPGGSVAADGSFIVRGVPASATYRVQAAIWNTNYIPVYYLTAAASTWDRNSATAVQVSPGQDRASTDLYLELGGSIAGCVTNAIGGVVARANVWTDLSDSQGRGFWGNTRANDAGCYEIKGMPAGQYRVHVGDPANVYANADFPTLVSVVVGGTHSGIDFVLPVAGSISGRVTYLVDGQPQPVVNVWVSANPSTTGAGSGDYTDATGDYTIRGLAEGLQYRVQVQPRNVTGPPFFDFSNFIGEYYDDKLLSSNADLVPAAGGLAGHVLGIDFQLALGGSISGVVKDTLGNPIQGVNVSPYVSATNWWLDGDYTDQNGFYIIRGIPAGTSYLVQANPNPLPFQNQWWQNTTTWTLASPVSVVQNQTTAGINFALAPTYAVTGTVKGTGGEAAPGMRVDAQLLDGQGVTSTTTAADGSFTVRLPAGDYKLVPTTTNTDYMPVTVTVTVTGDQAGVTLALPTGASISGHIYEDPANAIPVANVLVQVFGYSNNQYLGRATTDATGYYRVRGLPSATCKVQVESDDRNFVRMYYPDTITTQSPLVVTPPNEIGGIDFHLVRGNQIRGVVFYDADNDGVQDPGEPGLRNISINVNSVTGSFNAWGNSANDGTYVVYGVYAYPGVNAGQYRVSARAQSTPYATEFYRLEGGVPLGTFRRDLATPVTVAAPGEPGATAIDLSLVLGGGITGVVRKQDGTPLPNINVNVNPKNWQGNGFGSTTDSQGNYLINGLAPGLDLPYSVSASDSQGTYVTQYFSGKLFSNDADGVIVAQRASTSDPLATQADFTMQVGGVITGVVFFDANGNGAVDPGEGLAGANVNQNEFASPNRGLGSTTSGVDGVFRLAAPQDIGLRIQGNSPSGQDYIRVYYKPPTGTTDYNQAQSISVASGGTVSGVLLGLAAGGSISGTVRDGGDQPIANLQVCTETTVSGQVSSCSQTNPQGFYNIRGLSPGPQRVRAGGSGTIYQRKYYDNQLEQNFATLVTVVTSTTVPNVNFRLLTVPSITGDPTVTFGERGGDAVNGIQVTATGVFATACADPLVLPCTGVDLGPGITISNLAVSGQTLTFDVAIAADAELGWRTLSVINRYSADAAAATRPLAFEVRSRTVGDVPAAGGYRLYVSDGAVSKLRIYRTEDNSFVGSIDVNGQPNGLAFSPDKHLLYAAGTTDRTVGVVDTRLGPSDTRLGREVGRVFVDGNAGIWALAATDRRIYVTNARLRDRILVLDAQTWASTGSDIMLPGSGTALANPYALRLDPTGRWLYVAVASSNTTVMNGNVTIIDTTTDTIAATISFPATVSPRGIAFRPDGARAYVVATTGTYTIDTATRTLVSTTPVPTTGGGNGIIDVAPYPSDPARSFAYIISGGRLFVFDVTGGLPGFLRAIQVGYSPVALRATPDGRKVFVVHTGSKDLYVLDTENLASSPAAAFTKFASLTGPSGSLAIGPIPPDVPTSAPEVSGVVLPSGSPARNGGGSITMTVNGSRFGASPIVWLQGTMVRGTVTSASAGSLTVTLPPMTPAGDFPVVVTNQLPTGNESGVSAGIVSVRPPLGFTPSQRVYISDSAHARVSAIRSGGDVSTIATEPFPNGLAITPDGLTALSTHSYAGPQLVGSVPPTMYYDGMILDLNPASPYYLTAVATVPTQFGTSENPAVPSFQDPNGVYFWLPNGNWMDTVSLIDPVTRVEIDLDGNPATSTITASDPYMAQFASRLAGISRLTLDGTPTDGAFGPWGSALTPDAGLLYVTTFGYGGDATIPPAPAGVAIVDTVTKQVVGHLSQADNGALSSPQAIVISPQGLAADIPPYRAGTVFVYVCANHAVGGIYTPSLFIFKAGDTSAAGAFVDRIPLPEFTTGMALSPDGRTMYLTQRFTGKLAVVDVTPRADGSGRVNATISYLVAPVGVQRAAVAGEDGLLYVGNLFRNEVYVYDISSAPASPQLLTTIGVGTPVNIAVQPALNRPRIGGTSPTWGAASGGTSVAITGANFAANATVEFRGASGIFAPAIDVVVANASTIFAVTPPGTGVADIRVTNQGADPQSDVLAGRFEYRSDLLSPNYNTAPFVASQALAGGAVTVEIVWNTDEPATSRVDYGTGGALTHNVTNPGRHDAHTVVLTGLTPGTTYTFRVTSADAVGNTAYWPSATTSSSFVTNSLPDTTPPEITAGPTASATTTAATVLWTTNEESTSLVRYDTVRDRVVGDTAPSAAGPNGLSHAVAISGLTPSTLYYFKVVSTDASGNSRTSGIGTFQTRAVPDTTPPVITSGPNVAYLSSNLVIVTWTTNEVTNGVVNYGVASVYEQSIFDSDLVTTHVVFLTNLLPGTGYGYQVVSTDASGNSVHTNDPFAQAPQAIQTMKLATNKKVGGATLLAGTMLATAAPAVGFQTPAADDTTQPLVMGAVVIAAIASDKAIVTAETDEVSSIRVQCSAGGVTGSAFDPSFTTGHSILLTGLTGGTTYGVTVVLTDPKGNARTVNGLSVTTPAAPDTQPPVMASVAANATSPTAATITWTTDEPADSMVQWGAGNTAGDAALTKTHAMSITGLLPGTTYTAMVSSADGSGNRCAAVSVTFATPAVPPVVTAVTPDRLVLGAQNVPVAISGSNFELLAAVNFGNGVTLSGQTVNAAGTHISAFVTVAPGAVFGPRPLTITNPSTGLSASAVVVLLDATPPVVAFTAPSEGATLASLTTVVTGTVSKLSSVTVDGVAATLSGGAAPFGFQATITLPAQGANRIVAAAVDASGNIASAAVNVNVVNVDVTPPQLILTATPSLLWPPNGKMVTVGIAVTVSDDQGPMPVVTLLSVTSNQPPSDKSGDIQGAAIGTDDRQVQLRAARLGTGSSRVYTLTYRATDWCGNVTDRQVTVTVPHDQRK